MAGVYRSRPASVLSSREGIDPIVRDLAFIDPARREQALAVSNDYDALIADIRRGASGMLTPAEKEMIETLESERHRDLEGLAAVDDQLLQQLGPGRFAEYDRSRRMEYRQLAQLVRRVNLPAELAAEVFSMRDDVSAESNRIDGDSALTTEARRAALANLANGTRSLIRQRLGEEAGNAYLRSANRWLNAVENGSAVSFPTPNGVAYRRVGQPSRPASPPGG